MAPRRSSRKPHPAIMQLIQSPLEDSDYVQHLDYTEAPEDIETSVQSSQRGLKLDLPPITNVHQAFKDMLSKRTSTIAAVADNKGFELRVGTICSGTEAPIFALKLIQDISQLFTNGRKFIELHHLFSVENEPFKQAYISRNAPGSIVFRDVVDFADKNATSAPTIMGDHCEIPCNIDLLIAGTSCVDFSPLNSQKKKDVQLASMVTGKFLHEEWKKSLRKGAEPLREDFFDDFREWLSCVTPDQIQAAGKQMGQSSTTFLSTICYINNHRPKMVILENLGSAPWDTVCDLFLHAADYAATYVSVDTKNYYIPQTRVRVYAVAVDRRVFGNSADQIVNEWKIQLLSLKRGASSPAQHWLLAPNDPLAMRARQDESEKAIANSLKASRENQWKRSKMRHLRVRRQCKLGKDRPLTAWGQGGIEKPYDRLDRLFLKSQNERVLDCVDIYYLQCRGGGSQSVVNVSDGHSNDTSKEHKGPMQYYDTRFKCYIVDCSQNIDRMKPEVGNFGITGCLTPRGINLITDQNRLVSGFEALILQGLPIRDLDLTRESQDELRDLAGNAMTTTVVGAALFSLLVAVDTHGKNIDPPPLGMITTKSQPVVSYQPLYQPPSMKPNQTWSTALEPFCDVQVAINLSERCRRYCYCNGGAKYSTEELVRCEVCGVIRCTSCAGNPKHQFGHLRSIKDPIMNDAAPHEIMNCFPTALNNIISNTIGHIPFRPDFHDSELQKWLLNSLRSATFYYTRVLISDTVTVCYSAKDDKCFLDLQAVISDRGVTWYLFLDPWSLCGQRLSKGLGIPPSQMLRPFGRVRIYPSTDAFIPKQNAWEFWVFTEISMDVDMINLHTGSIEIKDVSGAYLPSTIRNEVQSIIGVYEHHPECDTAEDSLHVGSQVPKRYLFKDTTAIGATKDDCYVISDECKRLEKHEFRDFCLKFLPEWTPQTAGPQAKLLVKGYWHTAVTAVTQSPPVRYMRHAGFRFVPSSSELHLNGENHRVRTLASVCIDSNMLEETYTTLCKYERVGPKSWAVVSRSDYSALFDLLAPVNANLGDVESTLDLIMTENSRQFCLDLPDVHWMEKAIDGTKTSDRSAREPYRLSSEMRVYEEKLRNSGEPLRIAVNIRGDTNRENWKVVRANYEVNVDLLLHRAANYLPRLNNCSNKVLGFKTTIDMKQGSLTIPNLRFEPLRKSLQRLSGEKSITPPKVFINGHTLTKQQAISLNWMLEKERTPPRFIEREIEECWFKPLNLRVLAVAERSTQSPGGILADDVGYGKTVISLALMQAQHDFDQGHLLRQRGGNEKNTLALAASLVLAPRHLVEQWRTEAIKFHGWQAPDVLVIKSSRGLQGILGKADPGGTTDTSRGKRPRTQKRTTTLLDEFRAAKLIIVSTAVFDNNYYTWLGKYAGSLAHPRFLPKTKDITTNPNVPGAFQDWYEDATTYARMHLAGFNPVVFNLDRLEIIEQRQMSLQGSWRDVVADYYDASTRLGCQVRRGKTGKLVDGEKDNATVGKEYDETARANVLTEKDFRADEFLHVLEAFSFARIIYDEFSYENFCVAQFVKNAQAHAKWVLSATPPTSNVRAVCDIGQLLGIHVARPVKLRPGLPLITEGPIVLRQNATEKQLSYSKLYTDKSVCERVEQAHTFLRHFSSANPFDEEGLGKIKVCENVICSHMNRFELARYLDMQRDLRNCDLDVSNLLKRHQLDSRTVTELPAEGGLRAGLALAYIASVDCSDDDDGNIKRLLSRRRRDLEEAKERLKYITNVAIWLVLRWFQEEREKKNTSATQFVADFAYHIESILDENAEVFDSSDGLEAVTGSIDEEQFEDCSQWMASIDADARNSMGFYQDLVTRVSKQMPANVWATYFQLSADRVINLELSEIHAWIRELRGRDPRQLTLDAARKYLRGLIADKQTEEDPESQQLGNSGKKTSDVKKGESDDRPKYPGFHVQKRTRGAVYTETEAEITDIMVKLDEVKEEVIAEARRVTTAENLFCRDDQRKCNSCGESCTDLHFLPDCGHFICSKHLDVRFCGQIESEKYPKGSGCSAMVHKRSIPIQQIDRCKLDVTPAPAQANLDKEAPKVSPKTWKIISTIEKILRQSNDKILVFYQFEKQMEEIRNSLEYSGISFHAHSTNNKNDSRPTALNSAKERVRIFQLNSEEAAGTNLQDANHVMFINTPIFGRQEDFEKYVKQAKGRAIRHGQRKEVHVYYFVTANTFEVDLLQLRKRSSIRLQKGDVGYFVGDADNKTSFDTDGDEKMKDGPHASC
ncbi:hypothetical protein F5Y09DRAFT_267628 [Xylaria sp. FL1042]|nr:hypothetical protein F5Y09DRAFT_267628 [Xylaria sp. FL1042]